MHPEYPVNLPAPKLQCRHIQIQTSILNILKILRILIQTREKE